MQPPAILDERAEFRIICVERRADCSLLHPHCFPYYDRRNATHQLCKIDAEGNPRKKMKCACVVVTVSFLHLITHGSLFLNARVGVCRTRHCWALRYGSGTYKERDLICVCMCVDVNVNIDAYSHAPFVSSRITGRRRKASMSSRSTSRADKGSAGKKGRTSVLLRHGWRDLTRAETETIYIHPTPVSLFTCLGSSLCVCLYLVTWRGSYA